MMSVYSNCFLKLSVDLFFYSRGAWYRSKLGQALLCGFQIYVLRWSISCPHLFLVQHYLCWLNSFKSLHYFNNTCGCSFSITSKKTWFSFLHVPSFGIAVVRHSEMLLLFFLYLPQCCLSQVLICQFDYFWVLKIKIDFLFSSCPSGQKRWLLHPSLLFIAHVWLTFLFSCSIIFVESQLFSFSFFFPL